MERVEEIEDFPEWAITYAMYGDKDGLTDEEVEEIDKWMADNNLGSLVDVGDDTRFAPHPAFGLACNAMTGYFSVRG